MTPDEKSRLSTMRKAGRSYTDKTGEMLASPRFCAAGGTPVSAQNRTDQAEE